MSDQRILRYLVELMENPGLTISPCEVLYLPAYPQGLSPLSLLPRNFGLLDKTLRGLVRRSSNQSEEIWYTDGSSFVLDGKRRARDAVVSNFETIKAKPLLLGTSAQLAELMALTRALELEKEKGVAIYTDSKSAFLVLHAHAAVWKEKRPLDHPRVPNQIW